MDIFNETPFKFGCIAGRIPFPGHSLSVIVKGTFDLVRKGEVVPSAEQQLPTGDEFYADDEEMIGGPRYASDFAYYKPLSDLTLVGHCHAPRGTLTPARRISFQVGDVMRSLVVYGDRHWMGPVSTDPEPFSKIQLRYDRSYGGKNFQQNPTGLGYAKTEDEHGGAKRYLPNIMLPGEQMATPLSRLEPAGFGPIHREWDQRKSKLGTYKGKYLKTRWPWFAEDMDWRYFNAAPHGLQSEFLRGDEALYFENLHPEWPDYRTRLSGIRTRCFVSRDPVEGIKEESFSEVVMNLDTLWVDVDHEQVVLVWRGWAPVRSERFEEIRQILVVSEQIDGKPESVPYYEKLLHQRLKEEDELWEETEPPEEPPSEIDDDTEKLIAEAEASYRKAMVDAGMDPDNPPQPSEEDRRKEVQILKALGIDASDATPPDWTREQVIARLDADKDLSGISLEDLDLSGIDFSAVTLKGAVLSRANLSGARFVGADLSDCVLESANLSGADLHDAVLVNTDLTGSNLSGATLRHARMTNAIFDQTNMTNARIENAEAPGAGFTGADLSGACFDHSVLTGADFSMSNLTQATFVRADLTEASVEGARGPGVVMDGANLTALRASEKSVFPNGFFRQVAAKESIWQEADLRGSDFSFSKLEGADFSQAILIQSRFRTADMKNARFDGADLTDADLSQGNLFESSFERSNLTRCDCQNANMYGSEFLNTVIDDTRLRGANLKMTKLANL